MNKLELYSGLIDKYNDKQIVVAIEELSELQKELCKHLRDKTNMQNIIEEIADVVIMVEQLCIYFGISQELVKVKIEEKLKRTEERLMK